MSMIIDGTNGLTFNNATTQASAGLVAGGTIATGTITTATVGTLNAPSGVLATQNGMTGIAKAWVNFNGVGSTTINSSFNVSSVTYNGTGNYTVNFTTAMPISTYVANLQASTKPGTANNYVAILSSQLTSSFTFFTYGANTNTQTDLPIIGCTVFSS